MVLKQGLGDSILTFYSTCPLSLSEIGKRLL